MSRAEALVQPGCAEVEPWIETFVDGEFGEAERGDIERHLGSCGACGRRARAQAAFKAGLKAAAPRVALPAGFRERMQQAVAREPQAGSVPRWRSVVSRVVPAAAAALVAVAMMSQTHHFSPVAAEAISNHRRGLPMEVAGSAEEVHDWFSQKVDFSVRPPSLPSATLVGARLAQIRDRQAAYLVYNVSGNRVSVFLFDPGDLPIDARHHRMFAGKQVFLDETGGYHVALVRSGGLGYAFASDLDEERMLQLVSSTVTH